MTYTSRMEAVTSPTRFGFTPVDVIFGSVIERPDRIIVMSGDALRNEATGEVVEFIAREGYTLQTTPLETV